MSHVVNRPSTTKARAGCCGISGGERCGWGPAKSDNTERECKRKQHPLSLCRVGCNFRRMASRCTSSNKGRGLQSCFATGSPMRPRRGAARCWQFYNGLTALHDAVWHGHLEAAQTLVEAGARTDLEAYTGLTPRRLAALYGYDDLVRYLDRSRK